MHYRLDDVNTNFNNCGHYPEWVVVECEGEVPTEERMPKTRRGTPLAYTSKAEAQATANRLNDASARAWRDYLNS